MLLFVFLSFKDVGSQLCKLMQFILPLVSSHKSVLVEDLQGQIWQVLGQLWRLVIRDAELVCISTWLVFTHLAQYQIMGQGKVLLDQHWEIFNLFYWLLDSAYLSLLTYLVDLIRICVDLENLLVKLRFVSLQVATDDLPERHDECHQLILRGASKKSFLVRFVAHYLAFGLLLYFLDEITDHWLRNHTL